MRRVVSAAGNLGVINKRAITAAARPHRATLSPTTLAFKLAAFSAVRLRWSRIWLPGLQAWQHFLLQGKLDDQRNVTTQRRAYSRQPTSPCGMSLNGLRRRTWTGCRRRRFRKTQKMSKAKRGKAQAKSWYAAPSLVRKRIAEINRTYKSFFPDRKLPDNGRGRKWAKYMMRTSRLLKKSV